MVQLAFSYFEMISARSSDISVSMSFFISKSGKETKKNSGIYSLTIKYQYYNIHPFWLSFTTDIQL